MRRFKCLIVYLFFFTALQAQEEKWPFWNDVQAFKKADSANFPKRNQILFIGSSSFTKWKDVADYFPGYPILNRAFGGSSLPDLILYAKAIVLPYHPKQILIYCGDNDLASSDTITANTVLKRFQILYNKLRGYYPKTSIVYVSIKPSPSRERLLPKVKAANSLIKNYLRSKKNTAFVDVYHKMLDASGKPVRDIFIEDNLHMNAKGYIIWQQAIKPYLLK